jgi:hypothetical protein
MILTTNQQFLVNNAKKANKGSWKNGVAIISKINLFKVYYNALLESGLNKAQLEELIFNRKLENIALVRTK